MFTDAVKSSLGFVASFLALGAIGFRYAIRRRHDDDIVWHAARRAARRGLIGALVTLGDGAHACARRGPSPGPA